jgi:hypothetical protein
MSLGSPARQPVRNRVDLHWALRTAHAAALLASGPASKLLAPGGD